LGEEEMGEPSFKDLGGGKRWGREGAEREHG